MCIVLQPTDARRAFPCWDEPAVRTTFDITLVVPKDRVALSNMVSTTYFVLSSFLCPSVLRITTLVAAWCSGWRRWLDQRS